MTNIKYVIKRNGDSVPFVQERITNAIFRAAVAVGGRDKTIAQDLSNQVVKILDSQFEEEKRPSVEEIQDIVEKVLIENGHAKVAKAYILYREERNRKRKQEISYLAQSETFIPWAKLWKTLDWAVDHEVNTVEKLNKRIESGEIADIAMEAETAYAQDVYAAVNSVWEHKDEIKLVIVAGPSSSGKTTTTRKIALKLAERGVNFLELNLDNYYFDIETQPKDEFGDYDFETPQALDLNLINLHLRELLSGKEIRMPIYDFKTGKRFSSSTPTRLAKNEVILIDSLYGLYPAMTDGIDQKQLKLYVEPLLQMKDNNGEYIRWTDVRLMRRMLRDATHRGYDYERTLTHWHYVRSGETRNIFPYISSADFVINSGMPHELSIYRPKLLKHFLSWSKRYREDPLHQDAYQRASRVYNFLETITPVEDETIVPKDSVLREFLGGLVLN
jgi:uridine kinase